MFESIDWVVFGALAVAYIAGIFSIYSFINGAVARDMAEQPKSIEDINQELKGAFGEHDDDSHFTWNDEEDTLVQKTRVLE